MSPARDRRSGPSPLLPARFGGFPVPAIIADAGAKASEHFLEFFDATIRNPNTRAAYVQAAAQFFWLVIKQAVPDNPALFVKGPKFSRHVGITLILEPDEMRKLLKSIPITREVKIPKKHGVAVKVAADLKGLRDRAIIAIRAYTFARVSAVLKLKRGDYTLQGKRARLRLLEKEIRISSSGCITRAERIVASCWRR